MDVQIPPGEQGDAKPNDMVSASITRWPTAARGPVGRVTEVLGDIDEPGVDTEIIIRKHGIPDAHGEEAIEEARRLGDRRARARPRRPHRLPLLGDGDDRRRARARLRRRDHDRAACRTATTGWACTSPTSRTTSPRAARSTKRPTSAATSVYFPDRAVHMFPSELSTGLCSLNPHVDRLVQSCLMEVDRKGDGGALRDPRRRHPQRRAHDLHRRQRDPHRPRRGDRRALPRARAAVRADARALRDPQPPAAPPRVDRLRSARSRRSCSTTRAWSRRSSPPSATSRTG